MFAIAFDLIVEDTERAHPKSVQQAYTDIRKELGKFGFQWRQGSVYVTDNEDIANLFLALEALKKLPWLAASIRDIRAFRVEQWSDVTPAMRSR